MINLKRATIIQISLPPDGLPRDIEIKARKHIEELEVLFMDMKGAEVRVF